MNPLDRLFGEGTSEAFAAALPDGDKATVHELSIHGYIRVNVKWPRSELKIDCWPEQVHFLHLRSGRKGLYSDLCDVLPELFRERGVKRFTASPADPSAAEILLKRGVWMPGPRGLVWEL